MERVACAPGKVILSGEHAVVHGAPALALAVDRHMRVHYEPDRLPRLSWHAQERTHVLGLDKFSALRHRLDSHFERYLRGELSITEILRKPAELAFYAVDMARMLSGLGTIPRGRIRIDSDIPIGAGMGSSAALIAALLKLFGSAQNNDELVRQIHHCERLQHGRGSLIDAAAVCNGGLVELHDGQIHPLPLDTGGLGPGWFWVFTGTPAASTGACVERVRQGFAQSSIWEEFADLTQQIRQGLAQGAELTELIRQNHRLLTRIGVVPAPLVRFAEQVEQRGGAAKVSGAGSVTGDNGGLMLVQLPDGTPDQLDMPDDWHWGALKEEPRGVHILDDQGAGAR